MENTFNLNKTLFSFAVGIGIVAFTFAVFAFFKGKKEEPMSKKSKITRKYVKTQAVDYKEALTEIIAFGRVNSSEPLDVVAEVQGKIREINVPLKEGQRFSKGSVLFQIDASEARLIL